MLNFENLAIKELKMLAIPRSISDHENMPRQKSENIFTTPCTSHPTWKSIKLTSMTATRHPKNMPTLFLKPKNPVPNSVSKYDEFEKCESRKADHYQKIPGIKYG